MKKIHTFHNINDETLVCYGGHNRLHIRVPYLPNNVAKSSTFLNKTYSKVLH